MCWQVTAHSFRYVSDCACAVALSMWLLIAQCRHCFLKPFPEWFISVPFANPQVSLSYWGYPMAQNQMPLVNYWIPNAMFDIMTGTWHFFGGGVEQLNQKVIKAAKWPNRIPFGCSTFLVCQTSGDVKESAEREGGQRMCGHSWANPPQKRELTSGRVWSVLLMSSTASLSFSVPSSSYGLYCQ